MATFAKAPNSCELGKIINGNWALQIKPVGADPSEYRFVRGASSINAVVTGNTVDSSDIDSGGWDSTLKTSRSLAINIEGSYIEVPELGIIDPTLELLKISGEELGTDGKIDARVWRTDVDEGWEGTFNNVFTPNTGARTDLRSYTSALTNSCAPTRIHSVEAGAETEASVAIEDDYVKGVLAPSGAGSGEGGAGSGEGGA